MKFINIFITTKKPSKFEIPENMKEHHIDWLFGVSDDPVLNDADWYSVIQKKFKPDTIKVVYDKDTNLIRMANVDASLLCPMDQFIAEINKESLPKGVEVEKLKNGEWAYSDGKIVPYVMTKEEKILQMRFFLNQEKRRINDRIAELQDAVDLGRATKEQAARLLELKHYRVDLLNLDPDKDFDKEWRKPL